MNLKHYVYMLIDPETRLPFYIGEGQGNRVFDHVNSVLNNCECNEPKRDKIREILDKGMDVQHVIVRHGMTINEAYDVEASLIDAFRYCLADEGLTNLVEGHNHKHRDDRRVRCGLMTDIEIRNQYSAQLIGRLDDNVVIININKRYHSGMSDDDIYGATRSLWAIAKCRIKHLKIVLAEYRGLIVGVYAVKQWHRIKVPYGPHTKSYQKGITTRIRYEFDRDVLDPQKRDRYIGKCLPKINKQSPIIYAETINRLLLKLIAQTDKTSIMKHNEEKQKLKVIIEGCGRAPSL